MPTKNIGPLWPMAMRISRKVEPQMTVMTKQGGFLPGDPETLTTQQGFVH